MKRLGVEIEFTGVKRECVIRALENLFHSEAVYVQSSAVENPYEYAKVPDSYGNFWRVVRDRSIKQQVYAESSRFELTNIVNDNFEYSCELVSPILTSSTLHTLFIVVEVIKALGGVVNNSCGLHIHIDKPDAEHLSSLFEKYIDMQDSIYNVFCVQDLRTEKYCKKFPKVEVPFFTTEQSFLNWYYALFSEEGSEGIIPRTSRYYGLNMHSIKTHNTVEFRFFNSSLNSAEIAKYIQFVLDFCYEFDDICNYKLMLETYIQRELRKDNIL